MRAGPLLRGLGALAVAASVAACGFSPQPKSGAFACSPQGSACCPDGYVCVGRSSSSNAGYSLGTCWYKDDLPLAALVLTHDQTPGIPNDPACLVTDWLPSTGTDGASGDDPGAVDAPQALDEGDGYDAGAADAPEPLDEGGSYDAGALDAPAPLDAGAFDAVPAEDSPTLDLGAGGEAGPTVDGAGAVVITGLAAHGPHACAVVNGGVRCWGNNESGQLGDGTTEEALAPVPVVGLPPDVTAVRTGIYRTCAIVDGGARCWGTDGNCSELAARVLTPRLQKAPVAVTGLESGVTDLAVGLEHTCAVVNGAALCWGSNKTSQVGDEGSKGKCMPSPVQVPGLASGVTAIVAGNTHTCALVNGGVRCWGANTYGQLGDNSTTERTVPTQVVGLEAGVTALSAGVFSTCAVVNGAAKCWGDNAEGDLGDGTRTDSPVPVQVLTLTSNVSAIAAGSHFACAVVAGAPKCWGLDPYGSMFIFEENLQPVGIYWVEAGVESIVAGNFTCAVVYGGLKCWGEGHLGDGAPKNRGLPVDVVFP